MELNKNDNWPTSEWRFSLPEAFGIDDQILLKADNYIKNKLKSVNSMLIVKNGHIIFERYYNNYDCNMISHIASITKCIMSSLVGIAIKEGYIESVHQKISDFIPELKSIKNVYKYITLHQLMTMTSGITYTDISIINKNSNWIPYILDFPANIKPGSFIYNDLNAHLLSVIITRLTNMSTKEFADKYLFSHLGINISNCPGKSLSAPCRQENTAWWVDTQGYNTGGWGLFLNARDMAKIGYLYLKNGIWDGYEILPRNWIAQSTKAHVKLTNCNSDETGYGYCWWTSNVLNQTIYFARGRGEQYIINCPELDMVTVFKCQEERHQINLFKFWKLYILPYMK